MFFFNSPSQPQFQHTAAAEIGLLQSHRREKAPMEICLAPARQAQQMQQFQAAQKVPGVWWHHGKVPWAAQRMMALSRRLPGQKEVGLAPFIVRPMGIALGSCLLPPPPPSWQPPLCCQAQANFPLVRGKTSRSTCYGFIQYSFNHILKCEINGTVYIPLFFIQNKFIFTLAVQLNTGVMKKHSF